jgi:hypothetical protein
MSAPVGRNDHGTVHPELAPCATRLVHRPEKGSESGTLPSTWLADEIGRAVVRAIELGIGANNLLDRDMRRLLNTVDIGATLFQEAKLKLQNSNPEARAAADVALSARVLTWNAGVMIRYMVEVGHGVQHAPTDNVAATRSCSAGAASGLCPPGLRATSAGRSVAGAGDMVAGGDRRQPVSAAVDQAWPAGRSRMCGTASTVHCRPRLRCWNDGRT